MKYGYSNGLNAGHSAAVMPVLPPDVALLGGSGAVSFDPATGTATAQVTAPAEVAAMSEGHPNGAGWFDRSHAALLAAPSVIAPPRLAGGTAPGEVLSLVPAVWLCGEPASAVSVSFDLEVDRGAGYAPVPGFTSGDYGSVPSYTIQDSDRGASFRLRETAAGSATGAAASVSAEAEVPAAPAPVTLPTLVGTPIIQDVDLGQSGTETTPAALPAAGRYLVGIVDLTSNGAAALLLEGPTVSGAIALGATSGSANTHVMFFLLDATGPGDLTVRNSGTNTSLARQLHIFTADGLQDGGALFVGGTATPASYPQTLTLADAPAGGAVIALSACRDGSSSDTTWSGALTDAEETSDALFSNAAHRGASAVIESPGGDVTVSSGFTDYAGGSSKFAMGLLLLAASPAAAQTLPSNPHPGFQRDWQEGNHYTFETDATNLRRMVIEPGEGAQVWYCADSTTGGLTAAQIAAAVGGSPTVDSAWLRSSANTDNAARQYGLRSDRPVDWGTLGAYVHRDLQRVDGPSGNATRGKSYWWLFANGGTYGDGVSGGALGFNEGDSALHPIYYGNFVQPDNPSAERPKFITPITRTGSNGNWGHVVMQGLHRPAAEIKLTAPGANLLLSDMLFTDGESMAVGVSGNAVTGVTYYGTEVFDAHRPAPVNGSSWDVAQDGVGNGGDRLSGAFQTEVTGLLFWRTFFDHNGWQEGYHPDGRTWGDGAYGQPPAILSHNIYTQSTCADVSYLELLSARAAGTGIQKRAGGVSNCVVSIDDAEFGVLGASSAGDQRVGIHSAVKIGGPYRPLTLETPDINWGQAHTTFLSDLTLKQIVLTNGADPNNPAEAAQRTVNIVAQNVYNAATAIANTGKAGLENAHSLIYRRINWFNAPDHRAEEVASADQLTVGAWRDLGQAAPLGTSTTDQALAAIRVSGTGPLSAWEIWNHVAARTGDDTIGHAPGATCVFSPDPDADGYRADWRGSWNVNGAPDWPVDGDNVQLNGNRMHSFQTFRLADLDFGDGGELRLFGGLISAATSRGFGTVELRNAAKFRVGTGVQAASYDVVATGGRYEVDGTVSGVSVNLSGKAQCVVFGGGALTIGAGESLVLTGDTVKVGFDAVDGSAATLTLAGTLTFVSGANGFSRIREVRSGRFGLVNLGGGVTAQPVAPDVVSSVVLGGVLNVNISGLAAGTYSLIAVDSLSGAFSAMNVTGGTGSVNVDTGAGTVTVTVG